MARLFGTDGVRGIAITELNCELAMNIGRAAADMIRKNSGKRPTIQIAKDTRVSSSILEAALTAGITSVGADVELLGVIPTPALAFLVEECGAFDAVSSRAGIMISASHNTMEYNGIKIFSGNGFKLTDEQEDEIELAVKAEKFKLVFGAEVGRIRHIYTAVSDYVEHIIDCAGGDLNGLKLLVDSANGSASTTCRPIFNGLNADCEHIYNIPNGININENCGSTHIENLCEQVKQGVYDAAVAFDGDADRCLAVDEKGNIVNGDEIMALLACDMKAQNRLNKDTLVCTVMSNMGFHKYLKNYGINTISAKVGDRYVLEEMLKNGYSLGGEQSGHLIFSDHATTGDGQLTAVKLLSFIKKSGKKLSELVAEIPKYPQMLIGVMADEKKKEKWKGDASVLKIIAEAESAMKEEGRILVRESGTEPLIRVMIEGKDKKQVIMWAEKIADAIKQI
ncbi:MAG: phosphoglucosamine mutase [Eubacterium sp.]|jgi:phosphoglucosamine mutase|nr:phosphoglucosamine mutase [Eubacterium sp.]